MAIHYVGLPIQKIGCQFNEASWRVSPPIADKAQSGTTLRERAANRENGDSEQSPVGEDHASVVRKPAKRQFSRPKKVRVSQKMGCYEKM